MLGSRIVRDASTLVTLAAVMSAWLDEGDTCALRLVTRRNGPVVPSVRAHNLYASVNSSKRHSPPAFHASLDSAPPRPCSFGLSVEGSRSASQ